MADKEAIRRFFTAEEEESIVAAIREAEKNTSGEIRVHIEEHCKTDAFKRATQVFHKLRMDATKLHNGVLIYLATEDHKFAIAGDSGIHKKVPAGYWESIRDAMQEKFRHGQFTLGLSEGIAATGVMLKEFYPYQKDDTNELPDGISTS
jgi:uncharacterized membrane protein